MEAASDSPAYRARVRSWNIKTQLERLAAIKKKETPAGEGQANIDDSIDRYLNNWDFEPPNDPDTREDDIVVINPEVKAILEASSVSAPPVSKPFRKPRQPFSHPALEVDIMSQIDTDLKMKEELLRAELENLFTDLNKERYRLHAVICHAGQTAKSGHYWVWIYDFGARVWRKYNDTTVTERKEEESAALLEELSKAGEPYYLAYVKEDGLEGMVEVPSRQVPEAEEQPQVEQVEGDVMEGVERDGTAEELPPPYDG
jgi:ubiquitin carboxyl-terminal hydrolase 25/28